MLKTKHYLAINAFIAIIIFLSFGFYHLTKFETSDEHLWKNIRIPLYWQAINKGFQTGDWQATYINDKPGVSLALISGPGLLFIKNPLHQHLVKEEIKYDNLFRIYDVNQTKKINLALRLPLLLFNGLIMLPLLIYLAYQALGDKRITGFFILFLGLNPIIIGISQILNPDALLWSFCTGGLLSFIALLKTKQIKFIWLTGILTGLALLSKYTANLLFLFFPLIAFLHWIYDKKINQQYWKRFLKNYLLITFISWIVFAIFLPAVIQSPNFLSWIKPKHFAYGTYFSPALKPIILPLILSLFLLIFDSWILNNRLMLFLRQQLRPYRYWLIRFIVLLLFLFFSFAIFNSLSGGSFIPLDDLKEKIGSTKKLNFYFTVGDPLLISYFKQIAVESFNFIFSLPVLMISLLIYLWLFILLKPKKIIYPAEIVFISLVPFIFFGGGLLAKVFVNVRYSILLYPLFALFSAIALDILVRTLSQKKIWSKKILVIGVSLMIITYHSYILFSIKPFFFNFQNIFLPKKYTLSDSWSYGIYEVAEKLNALPQAKNLIVWSDRGAFCRYFIGHCLKNRKINRAKTAPDFFIVTRRNVARKRFFEWKKGTEKLANHPAVYYYQGNIFNHPWWELQIDHRPKNYIKIIQADEKK